MAWWDDEAWDDKSAGEDPYYVQAQRTPVRDPYLEALAVLDKDKEAEA